MFNILLWHFIFLWFKLLIFAMYLQTGLKSYISVSNMTDEKLAIQVLLRHYWKEMMTASRATAVVKICKVEGGECTLSKTTAIEWLLRPSANGETCLADQQTVSGRPSTLNIGALRKLVEQQTQINTHRLLAQLGSSKFITIKSN